MGHPKTVDPNRVAIYIRWSTDDQSEGTTAEVQLAGCRHFVLSQGWKVNRNLIFIDDGWSGGTLDRPAMARLRAMVKAGQVDCVVVYKLDRLSRSVIDMVNLVLGEWDGLSHVRSSREPVDTLSPMGKQFFYMLVSFAEWERSVIRDRTASGRLARAKEGYKASSRAPYGYRHGARTGAYEVDPVEGPVVQRVFGLYTRGLGAKAIASQLNEEGVPFRGGKPWNERTLLYLLSNPVYTGAAVYGRLSRNPWRTKENRGPYWLKNEEATVVHDSPFIPPLVDGDLFARAQEAKAGRRFQQPGGPSPRATASPYLITGLARCRCGFSLYARTERQGGRTFDYYACMGKKARGKAFCGAANIPRDLVDRRVEQEVLRRFGDRVALEQYQRKALEAAERESAEVDAALSETDRQIARLEAQDRQIRNDYRAMVITAADFRSLRRDVAEDLDAARTRRQQLSIRQGAVQAQSRALSARLEAVSQIERWAVLAPHERKALVRAFMRSMTAWLAPGAREVELSIDWHSEDAAGASRPSE